MRRRLQLWLHLYDTALQRPAVRRLIPPLVAAYVIVATVAVISLAISQAANDAAVAGLRSQTENRTSNVATWCGAINTLQSDLVGYVEIFVRANPRVPSLKLTPLDCRAIESKTLASTRPR